MKHFCLVLALLLLGCLTGCGPARPEQETKTPEPSAVTYTVYCYDAGKSDPENLVGVEGVIVNFCTDTSCVPVTSAGEEGAAVFTGAADRYHVQIVKLPEGWRLAQEEAEWYTEPSGEVYRVALEEVGE